ncbi:LICD family protein [Streptococcus sp. M143]|uniref:Lipopolysaccharide cholinephosphotransferase LicD2 n=1 Tax=Streptococcus oralis TaxID=1303 RepID=A0A139PFN0_STROR|nr:MULTISPECIES: LicD family protein [Streptococcus]EFA24065.1 LICD family protein [Streptococcus sp. M143]KXT88130.1 Lipopolysaccharide cholinephosphotransferase LicD2 [Streptococcus oralis]
MNQTEMVKLIQKVELDAIKEFQKICKENKIDFFLRGGSVLGAVKYDGFIPWDDDMDIAVPREGYDKLPGIFKGRIIAGKYQVLAYQYCDTLHCYFPRLFLLEDERKRLGLPRNTNLGLHLIDIIPLDGAPNHSFSRKLYFGKVYWYRFLASLGTTYVGDHVDMHSVKQKLIIGFFKKLGFAKLFPQNSVYRRLDNLYKKYDWKKQRYAGTINASLFAKEVMPVEIWGEGVEKPFEDTFFKVPTEYDRYLKRLYGENYLHEEPSDDEKKSHLGGQ